MKATINNGRYEINGEYLNEIDQDRAYFVVPKGVCDNDLVAAVMDGSIDSMKDANGRWLVRVKSEMLKWEE